MNKKLQSLIMVITFLSLILNVYLAFLIMQKPNEHTVIVDNNFICVIQNIIEKIEQKQITVEQREVYRNSLIEIIKKYPK